ncbi:hypothetical protein JXB22_02970 [candidate division WOR-3 bacterium]|nr:hypothetical protein [candidate division WOR-3 bacterium]
MMMNAVLALGTLLLIEIGIFVLLTLLLMPRKRGAGWIFLILSIIIGGAQTGVWVHDAIGVRASRYYSRIKGFLDASPPLLGEGAYKPLAIVTLSNMAEGLICYGEKHTDKHAEISAYLERIIDISMKKPVCPYTTMRTRSVFTEHGVYLAHFNVILNMYEQHTKDTVWQSLHRRISVYLARRTMASSNKHVRSYPDLPFQWPADQSVILYSLYLYDVLHDDTLSRAPIKAWLEYMERNGTDQETGLHISSISRHVPLWDEPRGCAVSWTLKYMAYFAPDHARALWDRYRKTFKKEYLIVAGFREYGPGIDRDSDIDSGPIVYDIGMAATGFAFGAAKANKDLYTYYQLTNALSLMTFIERAGFANDLHAATDVLDYPLTAAVLFNAAVH